MFPAGKLGDLIHEAEIRAGASGRLTTLPTRETQVEERGVSFIVRVAEGWPASPKPSGFEDSTEHNPFLPPDPQLLVASLSDQHLGVLNKFPVVPHHLLIVTRAFEHQESPLTWEDFAAWWQAIQEMDGLGFYNGGPAAGASQPHKHLQVVPRSLGSSGVEIPTESLIRRQLEAPFSGSLAFPHAVSCQLPASDTPLENAAQMLLDEYETLLGLAGVLKFRREGQLFLSPYNLLLTSQWMLAIPRAQETVDGIALNALAYAGALLVRSDDQLRSLQARGPLSLLAAAAATG